MKIKHINITDLKVGDNIGGIYLVKSHSIKVSKTDKRYLDITIMDKTGEINGKLWNIEGVNCEAIKDSDFIAIKFTVDEYNDSKQARIVTINQISPEMEFDKSQLVPSSPINPEILYRQVLDKANNFNNAELRKLVTNILTERKQKLLVTPGAKSVHHAVVGGLLLHTAGMLNIAEGIIENSRLLPSYTSVNKELLFAGLILHDVCKIEEFEVSPIGIVTDYSKEGKLLGHLHMGASYVERKCDELQISSEVKVLISHMLLSHHGQPEYGSPIKPMFLEAALLNLIDLMDSRISIYDEVLKTTEDGTFSPRVFALDGSSVYKHNLNTQPEQPPVPPMPEFGEQLSFI